LDEGPLGLGPTPTVQATHMAIPRSGESTSPKHAAIAAIAQAQADLERAGEEIDKLPAVDIHSIALAAHALNNFLTVSSGAVHLLLPLLRHHPDHQVAIWLEKLSHANDLMTHTVSQLMNNTVGAPVTLQLEEVELPILVERACAYYRRAADRKGIALIFHATGAVPVVRTDRVLVGAVLDNLLSNAVKYSPVDRRIWVELRAERDGAVCSVRDEGHGLSPDEQARLFLLGVRLTPVPSGGETSSGYGLAIAKSFVDLLGGELTCESTVGHGTTFSLWLPGRPPRP
jgi:signal transduction histidine kinase